MCCTNDENDVTISYSNNPKNYYLVNDDVFPDLGQNANVPSALLRVSIGCAQPYGKKWLWALLHAKTCTSRT